MSRSVAEKLLDDVAERFKARVRRGKFRALCPAHADKSPSLNGQLGEHGDRVVIHCHAGCDVNAVLRVVGLTITDLFVRSARQRRKSPLHAARVFRPDRRQWKLDVLASKLPALARDILADLDVQRLFPCARSSDSRARSIRRLSRELGVVTSKGGMREGWLWTLERAQSLEGDTASAANPGKGQQTAEGDSPSGSNSVEGGQKRPFAPSSEVQQTAEGDTLLHVRYEERRPSDVSAFLVMEKAVAEAVELFDGSVVAVRAWNSESESRWRAASPERRETLAVAVRGCQGCSRCGDARALGLYAQVQPGVWLCAHCWGPAGRRRPMEAIGHE